MTARQEEASQLAFEEALQGVLEEAVFAEERQQEVAVVFPVPEEGEEESPVLACADSIDDDDSCGSCAINHPSTQINSPVLNDELSDRMTLSGEEHTWACSIKVAIESDAELDNLSDYMYVQLALIEKQDVKAALDRANRLQAFRQEYKIVEGSLPQAQQAFQRGLTLFPGFYLSLSYILDEEGTGAYTSVFDLTKMTSETLKQRVDAQDILMRSFYFQFHSMCPDFEAIREGYCAVVECDGFDPKKQFGLKVVSKHWNELILVYPFEIMSVKHYHTGVLFNILVSLAKRVLPWEVHRRLEVGLVCPAGRLSNVFLTPSLSAANERLMKQFTKALQLRYQNEANFTL